MVYFCFKYKMNVLKHFVSVEYLPNFLRSKKLIIENNIEVLNYFNETCVCFKEPFMLSKVSACSDSICWPKIRAILEDCLPLECVNINKWKQLCVLVGFVGLYSLLCQTCICVPHKLGSYIVVSTVADFVLTAAKCKSVMSSVSICLYALNSTFDSSGDSPVTTSTIPLGTCSTALHSPHMSSVVPVESSSTVQSSYLSIGSSSLVHPCHVRITNKAKCKKRRKNWQSERGSQLDQHKSVKKTRRSKQKKHKKNAEIVDDRKAFERTFQIPVFTMLYNFRKNEEWPPHHILCSAESVEMFLDNVLSTRVGVDLGPLQKEKLQELSNLLHILKVKHKRLSHKRLLEHHASTMHRKERQSFSSKEVYFFVNDVVRRVVPLELFGTRSNRRVFLAAVRRLTLLGLHHTLPLGTLLQRMRTSRIKWLLCMQGHAMRQHILAKVMLWLFTDYVMVLLKSFFYITESSSWNYKLFFCWKRDWQLLQNAALQNRKFLGLPEVEANKIAAGDKQFKISFGIGGIRFVPKENGLREIQSFRNVDPCTKSMAKKAKALLCQLNQHRGFSSSSSVQDSLHSAWLEMDVASRRELYLVKTDIKDAYGSILHKKLVAILLTLKKELLEKGRSLSVRVYRILRLHPGSKQLQEKRHLVFDGIPASFPANSLIIFLEEISVDGEHLFSVLLSYVQRQVVQVSRQYFLVQQGLPHGGLVSPALCDLYYGTMESRHVRGLCAGSDRLMRAVDDYLFVTHSKAKAQQFLRVMNKGFPKYNCFVNREKTQANVMVESVAASSKLYFCGMEIQADSLEVKGSYEKMRGCDVAYSLQLRCTNHPGRFLENYLHKVTSLKLNRVFLDETYNSAATVLQTVYEAALLCAFRVHAIVRCTFRNVLTANRRFMTRTITAVASKLARCVCRNSNPPRTGHSALTYHMVRWLTFRAFHVKFSLHGGRYKDIVHDMRYLQRRTSREFNESTLQILQEATRNKLPDPFHTMK